MITTIIGLLFLEILRLIKVQRYKILTISHKTTHLHTLKDYLLIDQASQQDYPAQTLQRIKDELNIQEILYLNTCNRVTFFFTSNYSIDKEFLLHFFKEVNPNFNEEMLEKHASKVMIYEDEEALRHLFGVSASLDSLVVGEREILGQLKKAYSLAKAHGLCKDAIRLAIDNCIVFAKKIYSETRIGEKPVSVVSLAFREMLNRGICPDAKLYMIGAGQTNQLIANLLVKYGFKNVKVFNRSLEKANELAQRFIGGQGYTLEEMETCEAPDFLVTCTGSAEYILNKKHFDNWKIHPKSPFTIIDLAIPSDVDPAILNNYTIDYISVPSLKKMADQNMEFRKHELIKAYEVLETFIVEFQIKFKERQLELAFSYIPQQVKELKRFAIEEVFSKELATVDQESRDILEKVINYMEKKYISIPMKGAKVAFMGEDVIK
jgi:glutamyl-tRNA reductase